jgi:hypothetical protein
MRNVPDKICTESINTHFMLNKVLFIFNGTVNEIMWQSVVESDRPQMKIWLMQIACWTTKATSTHSEYVIIFALPLKLWSHERTSALRYTFIALSSHSPLSTTGCVWELPVCVCPAVETYNTQLGSLHGRYCIIWTDWVRSEDSRDTSVEKLQRSVCQL